eukprot:11255390-Ditylum_brightwellii.AAC.1
MTLNNLLLCGMHATGDTFNFCGSAAMASSKRADLCGPCWMVASMWACVQSSPQSTGHPSRAY